MGNARNGIGSATAADLARPVLLVGMLASTWNAVSIGGLQIIDLALVLVAALCVLDAATSGRRIAIPWWLGVGTVTIMTIAVVHIFAPTEPGYLGSRVTLLYTEQLAAEDGTIDSLMVGARWCVAVAILPILVAYLAKGRERFIQATATAFVISAAISSGVAALDWLGITQIGQALIGGPSITGRQNGLASHVNNLGFSCVIAVPLALHMYGRRRLLAAVTVVIMGAGAFVSGSRTAQLGVIVALVASMIFLRVARAAAIWFAALATIAGAVLVASNPQVLQLLPTLLRFETAAGFASDAGRTVVGAQAAVDFATRPIVGIGLPIITHAHSVPLQLLASGGLILTIGMSIYWLGAVMTGWKLRRVGDHLALAATLSVVLWLIQFPFQNQLVDRFLYVPIALIIAVAVVHREAESAPPESEPRTVATMTVG